VRQCGVNIAGRMTAIIVQASQNASRGHEKWSLI
jgi:hypothetical protein